MAAEVPITDVLCEAMEYLSKLGSNLRTRSENLKEKRISKAKLKNAHAVQKAASKVLLICELSKKSLDNVETGVRKVLALLEASQATSNIGGNSFNARSRDRQYHYFAYQSRKLRIAKKISLNHYTSVKVLAKCMPASMQDKYPVYYDCKLKRQRRRQAKKLKSELKRKSSGSTSDKEPKTLDTKVEESDNDNLNENENSGLKEDNDTQEKDLDSENKLDKRCADDITAHENEQKDTRVGSPTVASEEKVLKDKQKSDSVEDEVMNDKQESDSVEEEVMKDKQDNDSVEEGSIDNTKKVRESSLEKCSDIEDIPSDKKLKKHSHRNSKDHKLKQEATSSKFNKENKKDKKSKSRYAAIYSSDSDDKSQKDKSEKNVANEVNPCSDGEAPNGSIIDSPVHEPKTKKFKLNDSDDNSSNEPHSNSVARESDTQIKTSDKDDNCGRESDSNKSCKDSQNESGSESKPFIRCVNLSKLLKPDIINKTKAPSNHKKVEPLRIKKSRLLLSKKTKELSKKERKKKHGKKRYKISDEDDDDDDDDEDDEEYWAQKRKEVSEFKAKIFSINVDRLPSFTNEFLIAHNLNRIIRKGNVIRELTKDTEKENPKSIDAVKCALLNDSDSDEKRLSIESKKVKKSVSKDSDVKLNTIEKEGSNDSDSSTTSKTQNSIQNALRNLDSDLENHCQTQLDTEKSVTGTLNDTECEKDKETTSENERLSIVKTTSTNENNDECPNESKDTCNDESNTQPGIEQQSSSEPDHKSKSPSNNLSSELVDKKDEEVNKNVDKIGADHDKNESSIETKQIPESTNTAKSDENDKTTPLNEEKNNINEEVKSSLLNNSSDEEFTGFTKSDIETPTKTIKKVKSALLNDTSDEEFAGFSKDNEETPTKANLKVKCSLLKDSSDEKSDKDEREMSTENNSELKSSSNNMPYETQTDEQEKVTGTNDSTDDKEDKSEKEPSSNLNDEVKSSLLNNSSDEDRGGKHDLETPTKANEKVKSSLLKDSSDEKSAEEETTKDKVKCEQNETSDMKSETSCNKKKKRKTPKSKRKHARKSREAKKKLKYSSSSDSEPEMHRHKRIRKKSQVTSSSSSSEEITKKPKKLAKESNTSQSDNNTARTIDQVDGPMDEQSSSSFDKMVRSKAKPSGSSSLNSDNQDSTDKDIDGLTNLNNLSKNRRREHLGRGTDSIAKISRSKDSPIIGEDLLKAESSSDASDAPEDVAENEFEDLPPVSLSGLNGDAIVDHMAKDDLLGESDSSTSHNEKTTTDNMDETDAEENLKSKRRKANAISSDSEGGTHRRRGKGGDRLSDFEDSEDESSEPAKKSKRKKKVSDSDASVDSNDGGKKKRRRIKVVNDSDVSGSDTENEGRNKHGRKNIRKVMGKNQLEEATKKAAREEKERIARIAERQKLYNNLDFDESGKPDEVVLEKVVLDFDPETKEPLIQVDRGLVKKLKPHQANGIKFMWDACFESVKRIKKDKGSGCILAHCMGLGKTLQVISLTHTLLTHGSLTGVNRVLVVCPLSTVLNWVNEFRMWLKHAEAEFDVDVYELSRYKQNSERAFQLQQWFDGGGVCVLGYEMFRNLSADNPKKFKKKMLKSFQESLVDPGPDLVVCDEGHLLKNEKTSLSQSMNRVKTRRRIVLTGTPLQNNLKEYYCMVQFVKPNLLGKYNEYLNRFVNPITNGQYTDSTEHDIRVMKRRSHVLHKMLDGAVQRRDYGVLAPFLPPKHEYVLFITLSEVQIKLYQFYLDNYSRRPLPGKSSGFLFPDFQSLQRIWTHPLVLKYNSERYEIMQQKKREREEEDSEGSLVDFIDDDSTPDETSTEESSDSLSDMSDDSRKKSKKKKAAKKGKGKEKEGKASTRRGTRANPELDDDDNIDEVVEVKNENPTEWWIKLVEETELEDMRNSHKLVLLFDILRQCETIGDKLLVFSQSLYSLDLIEHFLGKVDEATQEGRIDEKLGGHVGSWSPGVDYFRLDGSTSCENRSIWCKNFNREDNPRARLFLISTRAGGLGINLVAANRVVIFDVSWNPSHDVQSIFRVYRFGQKKPCYIYRFLAMGTMEEKIYERQVTKQAISKRVIDEQQIDRHYAENDLAELYKFDAHPTEPRPLPTLPKDRLFAEMLKEHEAQIYKYHEHDSLLENKEEETLSEEERKAAWEDFENEKNKPPPAPFPSAWPMHNGMVPGLLAQQQQQLAYAALAAMLRKDMPNINDNQIRDMLPLIYNSNPGLMQKMSEIYKYAQPSMMNPNMMNPVMNAGSGSSGLQYEPPWQRQHQQQQQMRLQQLLQQQQNQMGAKFYAGGLGSRDPVAMALQQQRAREIMMGGAGGGGGAGRPRGRPPAHPRPPTTSNDVVNLDSD